MLGMLAVRLFYLTVQSLPYREHEIIVQNNFVIDWYYYIHRFSWENLVRSGWGSVIWPSMDVLSGSFKQTNEWLVWVDCERLPGGLELPATIEEAVAAVARDEVMSTLMNAVDDTDKAVDGSCPVSKAYAAILVAFGLQGDQSALKYLNRAQAFLRQYREKNDFTLVNLMHFQWPMWQVLSLTVNRLAEEQEDSPLTAKSCDLLYCPEGGTPNPVTCECEVIFPVEHRNTSICFFFVDTRRKSSLRNITSILNARFWTLTYGITRAYADEHGYEVEYVQPDNQTHFPERKVGWGKVKVIIDKLREYGPERCSFGVSIDTDAYMRTSEPLAAVIHHYGLDADKLILFSQEYHTENRPDNTFANGGFFIVRNSPEGVGLLEEWYKVPETYPEMYHLKKENPQGLNLCWDLKMQPRHSDVVVLAPPHLFTAPLGWYVRHNWFKDLRFEQEMQDVLLQRLQRRYGCIVCQNVFDWDDSLNTDVGWR
ncbi:unnamed protein product [Polarella glacialis]|uniref:Nucleotide-diphospho-sugar transferase domain-containing protein n=2 Tax=Polarella glacialis TaxID=89957 RepID=A0A813IEQ1_POLGL|nr:unnamed protein product [Polarella glacialis]